LGDKFDFNTKYFSEIPFLLAQEAGEGIRNKIDYRKYRPAKRSTTD
jgi:hypothetical protein